MLIYHLRVHRRQRHIFNLHCRRYIRRQYIRLRHIIKGDHSIIIHLLVHLIIHLHHTSTRRQQLLITIHLRILDVQTIIVMINDYFSRPAAVPLACISARRCANALPNSPAKIIDSRIMIRKKKKIPSVTAHTICQKSDMVISITSKKRKMEKFLLDESNLLSSRTRL